MLTYEELDSENDILFEQVQNLKRENDRLRCELDRVLGEPDTWERIIEDAFNAAIQGADERWDSDVDRDILVARCKALCERTKGAGE